MPEYRIRASGEVTTDLDAAFPSALIPKPPSAADLEFLGVDPILEGPQPTPTQFQSVVRTGPENIDGQWFWTYQTINWEQSAIDAATAAQWELVRAERNKRLYACDWTQLNDAPVDPVVWASYRQALREITTQSDPFNIIWPTQPA